MLVCLFFLLQRLKQIFLIFNCLGSTLHSINFACYKRLQFNSYSEEESVRNYPVKVKHVR